MLFRSKLQTVAVNLCKSRQKDSRNKNEKLQIRNICAARQRGWINSMKCLVWSRLRKQFSMTAYLPSVYRSCVRTMHFLCWKQIIQDKQPLLSAASNPRIVLSALLKYKHLKYKKSIWTESQMLLIFSQISIICEK